MEPTPRANNQLDSRIDLEKMHPWLSQIWTQASEIDRTLSFTDDLLLHLTARELRPERSSRSKLFSAIARAQPILFRDYPVKRGMNAFFMSGNGPAAALKNMFSRSSTTLAKLGPSQKRRYLRVHDVVDMWERGQMTMSANDIHFRFLGLDRRFDCSAISDFNILPAAPRELRHFEVATMLIGTRGAMSDSHSDDPDGCNHCVIGKKLWLVWDRFEGQKKRLQDTEHDDVYTYARFDLKSFLSLASARWFIMSSGRTLFLPGHLTHKVITLERYLGISSFYIGLPNALSSLSRWKLHGANMITERYWDRIAMLVHDQLRRAACGTPAVKRQWAFYHLREALAAWECRHTQAQKRRMLLNPCFKRLIDEMAALG